MKDHPTPPLLRAYLAAGAVAGPALRPLLARRRAAGKEDRARWRERLGETALARPAGRLAWFHAASVGESLSLLPLVEALLAARHDVSVLVTSGTVTSAHLLAERLPDRATHQYVPVDLRRPVARFLDHWRPDIAIWTESELWPRLIWATSRRGTPMLLINARLTARSLARWQRAPRTAVALLGRFERILAQDEATATGLRRLGVRHVETTGSVKQAAQALPCDAEELATLHEAIGDRFTWLAASTHPGEEQIALAAHRRLLRDRPDALLILAPRHPERGDQVAALAGGGCRRRAEGPPQRQVRVYLADTLGEMGLWYRLAPISFVGGSFGGVGGHNPYEPIALGSAVVHGPDTANFADIYAALDEGAGAWPVRDASELAHAVARLAVAAAAEDTAARARRIAAADARALETALQAVLERLPA